MSLFTISLDHIRMFAFHGIHKEERIAGGEFDIDMQVVYRAEGEIISIDQTVDYTALYSLVKEIMKEPTPLLETVCLKIGTRAKTLFPKITEINISISKVNPPVGNFQGQLKVSWHKQFES
jgi:7,8-dihydroneopterin aldolase/epimerase/oxygenase